MERCEKAALRYLELGWSVIPLGLDKRPMLYEWRSFQKRHPMPAQIHEWWNQWPDSGVGVITGQISNIIVVDLDSDKAVDYYTSKKVEPSPTVITAKGYHVYFKHPFTEQHIGNSVNSDIGIDIRGEGGYVVAPPSVHPTGIRYEWRQDRHPWCMSLAQFPEEFAKKKREYQGNETDEQHWAVEALQGISEGGRNNLCAQLAGRLILKGLGCREVYEILSMWNERNNPPLPEREVETTVRSIFASHRSRQ
jgi:hypothetical protein